MPNKRSFTTANQEPSQTASPAKTHMVSQATITAIVSSKFSPKCVSFLSGKSRPDTSSSDNHPDGNYETNPEAGGRVEAALETE